MEQTKKASSRAYLFDCKTQRWIQIFDGFVVGRAGADESISGDSLVSQNHWKIEMKNDLISIVDLGSTNHTYLSGKKIIPQQAYLLNENDLIEFGNQKFVFTYNPNEVPSAAQSHTTPHKKEKPPVVIQPLAPQKEGSASVWLFFWSVWIIALGVMIFKITPSALKEGLAFPQIFVLKKIGLGIGVPLAMTTLIFFYGIKKWVDSFFKKIVWTLTSIVLSFALFFVTEQKIEWASSLILNQIADSCHQNFDPNRCYDLIKQFPDRFERINPKTQEVIIKKLKDASLN
ncbi:MAG: hypothetical protein CL678_06560 [Bdellovibrionaceae bacterium]|nr:hypothetical protein [Pseudobdellovibrionaceae bacterium]|tara:strand:+ start:606 stop:1466 length:861 start_codon:yes stop_codon:yes gene_type:complete